MMIDDKELNGLAAAARLEIDETERRVLEKDLGAILDYVGELKQAALIGKGSTLKTQNLKVEPWRNNLRDDAAPHPVGLYAKELWGQARVKNGGLVVKAIFDGRT